jgi:hypothetical protein
VFAIAATSRGGSPEQGNVDGGLPRGYHSSLIPIRAEQELSQPISSPTIMLVAGARPNFMKIAPVLRALDLAACRAVIVGALAGYAACPNPRKREV